MKKPAKSSTKKPAKNETPKGTAAKTAPKRLTVDDLKDLKAGKCEFGDKSGCGT